MLIYICYRPEGKMILPRLPVQPGRPLAVVLRLLACFVARTSLDDNTSAPYYGPHWVR